MSSLRIIALFIVLVCLLSACASISRRKLFIKDEAQYGKYNTDIKNEMEDKEMLFNAIQCSIRIMLNILLSNIGLNLEDNDDVIVSLLFFVYGSFIEIMQTLLETRVYRNAENSVVDTALAEKGNNQAIQLVNNGKTAEAKKNQIVQDSRTKKIYQSICLIIKKVFTFLLGSSLDEEFG